MCICREYCYECYFLINEEGGGGVMPMRMTRKNGEKG